MAKNDSRITVERLRECVTYDPLTGILMWLSGPRAGKTIHSTNDQGYIVFSPSGVHCMRAHRVAWALMTGAFPAEQVDHINRMRSDNRWCNLREATHSQNHQNMNVMKHCKHGFRGIELHERGLWRARITLNHKRIHIGYFKTPEEAEQRV